MNKTLLENQFASKNNLVNHLFSTHSDQPENLPFLKKTKTDYQHFFDKIPAALLVLDSSGKILSANQLASDLLGYPSAQLTAISFSDCLRNTDRISFKAFLSGSLHRDDLQWEGHTDKSGKTIQIRGNTDEKSQNRFLILEQIRSPFKKLNRIDTNKNQLQKDKPSYRLAIEQSSIGIWKAHINQNNPSETLEFCFSKKGSEIFGFIPFTNINYSRFIAHVDFGSIEKIRIALASAINNQTGFDIEIRINKPNGDFSWINWKCYQFEKANDTLHMEGIATDITSFKTAEKALAIASNLFENTRDGVFIADQNRRVTVVNHPFTKITGLTQEDILGNKPWYIQANIQDMTCYNQICDVLECSDHEKMTVFEKNQEQQIESIHLTMKMVRDMDNQIISYIGILLDVSHNDFLEDHTRYMIEHDFLTGLPNRMLLLDRLGQTLIAAERNHHRAAVMFLDLDKFKHINDSLGHDSGDKLLQQVAERLTQCVRKNDTVSRQGGDEFVILLSDIANIDDAAIVANNIMHSISQNYQIENYEMSITLSIGIALYPEDGMNSDSLLKNADTAMYHAKNCGRNTYRFFNANMNRHLNERIELENDLKTALKNGDFFLEYQPVIDIHNHSITSVEALLRWQHPKYGVLKPFRFLGVAEDSGLIDPIGEWVIQTACKQARQWQDEGSPRTISINLSSIQLKQKNLLSTINNALQTNKLAPRFLELQITENSITGNLKTVVDLLHELRNRGMSIVLDNFGNGCSSISHLRRIPIEKIKIDPALIHALGTSSIDADIAGAIIAMAKNLQLKVSANGVETIDQLSHLKKIGCDEYQGYFVSPSLPPVEIRHFQLPN